MYDYYFGVAQKEFNLKDDLTYLRYYVQFVHVNPKRSHSGVLKGQTEMSQYLI